MKRFGYLALPVVLALLALQVGTASAQLSFKPVGQVGAQFLKIGVGAEASAMGGSYMALVHDVNAVFWNPAGLGYVEGPQVTFSRANWIADMTHNAIAAGIPAGDWGVFGVSLILFSVGDVQETTEFKPQGTGKTFSPSDLALGLTYATRLTDKVSFGLTGKYISQDLGTQITNRAGETVDLTTSGVALDVGVTYWTGFRSLRLGVALTNFGTDMEFKGTNQKSLFDPTQESNAFSIPQAIQFGVAIDFFADTPHKLTFSGDVAAPSDFNEQLHFGFQYAYRDVLFARLGMITNNKESRGDVENKMTFGVGLVPKIGDTYVKLDLSVTQYLTFDNVVRFSVGFGL